MTLTITARAARELGAAVADKRAHDDAVRDAERIRAGAYIEAVIELRLTHPGIDFWVDVRLHRFDNAWLAVADLASAPEVAVASRPDLAVLLALWPLGPALARRLVARATLPA